MSKLIKIQGKKGGGKKQHVPVESDDTLKSKQKLRLLWAVSEGEIEGVNNVYVNGTNIDQFDATWEYRSGTIDQTHIPGFAKLETSHPSFNSVELKFNIYQSMVVSSVSVDAVSLTFTLSSLQERLSNGDTVGYKVQFEVQRRPNSGAVWETVKQVIKKGKASRSYAWDYRVEAPIDADVWEVRVLRHTADDPDSKKNSVSYWTAVTEIQDDKNTYPETAIVGLIFNDADELGGQIPSISFDIAGRKIKIPSASYYDPESKIYTGVWSGAFALSNYNTDNPAWILYDVLTNDRVGLGISEAKIDRYSFYDLAVYCDEFIDDGNDPGGMESRFTMANQFIRRENASQFLTYIMTVCDASLSMQNGLITVISDRPTITSKMVTNSNVLDGTFNYSSSDLSTRYSSVNVTYNNKLDRHNTTTVTENYPDLLSRYGLISTDIPLIGCTSEGQARRKARWALESSGNTYEIINFAVGLEGLNYTVGEVVDVMDDMFSLTEQQFKVKSISTSALNTSIVLDRDMDLGDEVYTMMVYGADGITINTSLINQTNETTDTITSIAPLPSDPAVNTIIIVRGDTIPKPFRISSITEDERSFQVTGTEYDANKWARIEGSISNIVYDNPFTNLDEYTTEPIENISFEEIFTNTGVQQKTELRVAWDWDVNGSEDYKPTFMMHYRRDNTDFITIEDIPNNEVDIPNVVPGVYEVFVYAFNFRGVRSTGVTSVHNYKTSPADSTLIPPENLRIAGIGGSAFNTPDVQIEWSYPISNDDKTDVLLDYVVEIWTDDGVTLKRTIDVKPDADKHGTYTYTFADNRSDFNPAAREIQVKVYSRDVGGDISVPIVENFSNDVPGVTSFNINSGIGIAYIDLTPPVGDDDIAGYVIHRSETGSFTASAGNLVYDGPDTYTGLGSNEGTTYYYQVAAYDTFGKTGLNYSGEQSSTTLSTSAIDYAFDGMVYTPDDAINKVSWTAGSAHVTEGENTTTYSITAGTSPTWTSGTFYLYYQIGTTIINVVTDITSAMGADRIVVATYKGGTSLIVGNGAPIIDGNQILAGTVGANQLYAGGAIITGTAQIANTIIDTAHIIDGAIENAKIGNTIRSTNWNNSTKTGWNLAKDGTFQGQAIRIYDDQGDLVLGSGGGLDWGRIFGTGRPDDDATIGATFGSNITGQITWSTASTYIANGAIQTAQIGNAQIGNAQIATAAVSTAKIGTAQVDTLRIGNNAVTVPTGSIHGGIIYIHNAAWTALNSVTSNMSGSLVLVTATVLLTISIYSQQIGFRLKHNGVVKYTADPWVTAAPNGSGSFPITIHYVVASYGGSNTFAVEGWAGTGANAHSISISSIEAKR